MTLILFIQEHIYLSLLSLSLLLYTLFETISISITISCYLLLCIKSYFNVMQPAARRSRAIHIMRRSRAPLTAH